MAILALRKNADEFQSDGPATDDDNRIAGMHARLADSAQDASQWLGHGGILKGDTIGNLDHVLAHDAPRNADVLRVGAIIEKQILAKIRLALAAEETRIARRGICR
jgi:predicted regulator of Ras-like GTPase activity (Roadblock/LC7/MglB family)